jgi:two-component system phosphate regulon sensor histidine kinase PhoR
MNNWSVRKIALVIALVIFVLLFAMLFSFELFYKFKVNFLVYLSISLIVALTVYIGIDYYIGNVVFERIKLIYKMISSYKSEKNMLRDALDTDKNFLDRVQQEVDEYENKQLVQIEQMYAMEKYRKDFLGNVSHELKTPIFNIQGYIETLLDGAVDDPTINKQYLLKAASNVERLNFIVQDLLELSQYETGEMLLEMTRFDINFLVKEIYDSFEIKAKEKNVKLGFKKGSDREVFIHADKDKITQVFNNLIVNAINYGNRDGEVNIGFFDIEDNILIEVSDDGYGIAEEHLPRLFERFYRVDAHRSRSEGGTGLGLAIVKHILEAHGQTISVRSTIGKGSTFWFLLKKA